MLITTAKGRTVEVNEDYTIDQNWEHYTAAEHDRWDRLYARQAEVLKGRACDEFLQGLDDLQLSESGIPNFDQLNERLMKRTGWQIVAVPDLVPESVFFEHLANKRFPAGNFIRSEANLEYLEEPDVFHDVYGHVPMLAHPVFAEYMEAYGKGGRRAEKRGLLTQFARLYWYTVEFGLIRSGDDFKIYGSGIVSSKSETLFSLESGSPHRLHFDLERIMSTDYKVDDFQQSYFVIDSMDELLEKTYQDFGPMYDRLEALAKPTDPTETVDGDVVYHQGTQEYVRMGGRLADKCA
jgi:phenylalanine-4-hydroxylase